MTLDEQAVYWNEYCMALVRAGFTREEAVQMVTNTMCTNMWIVAYQSQR